VSCSSPVCRGGSFIQYPHSKLANILCTRELARRLGEYGDCELIIIITRRALAEHIYLRQRCFDASEPRITAATGAQYTVYT